MLFGKRIYVDNDNINESCLNNSELHLIKKDANLFSKNVSTTQDVIWNASTDTKDIDNANHNLKKRHDIDQLLSDWQNTNPSNLNFCYLNINSVKNKFIDFQETINGNVEVVSIAKRKIDASFPLAHFVIEGCHSPYRCRYK